MTTLCRSDWIEAYGNQELRLAQIDPLKLPTSSFEKMLVSSLSAGTANPDIKSPDSVMPPTSGS